MDFTQSLQAETWSWRASQGRVQVYFGGKGPPLERPIMLQRVVPKGYQTAWLDQVHSAAVVDASAGNNGQGDALLSESEMLAVAVVTADCVPVLLAGGRQFAAVHAGWRGLVQSILPATLERFETPAEEVTAWIGPAIGQCCYEVGAEVADQIISVSSTNVSQQGPRGRPHLDLVAVAQMQLERRGVTAIHSLGRCTQCDEARLWSYRREGPGAGRNIAAIWRD